MKKLYLAVAFLVSGLQCSFAQLSRQLDAFTNLEVTDKINVTFIPSTENKIIIEGELGNQMEIVQQNNTLRLKMGSGYLLQGDKVQVTLYASNINQISAKKGAKLAVKNTLQKDQLHFSVVEGAQIESVIASDKVIADAHTGANLTLKGTCENIEINSNLGGQFFGKELQSNNAKVQINGGGKAILTATQQVEIHTRAGGAVDVYGNPKFKTEKKFAGGKINYL